MQPNLFDGPEEPEIPGDNRTPYQRFRDFHADNPGVYIALREMARALKAKGLRRYGIKGIFETLRYTMAAETGRPFKLNNNLTAFYARLLVDRCPDLKGFFETRQSEADA